MNKQFTVEMDVRVAPAHEYPFAFGIELIDVKDGVATLLYDNQTVKLTKGCTLELIGHLDMEKLRRFYEIAKEQTCST